MDNTSNRSKHSHEAPTPTSTTGADSSSGPSMEGTSYVREDSEHLTLNPVSSKVRRIAVYETKTRFYLIGSNNTETMFRVLKIDRTEPRLLVATDDKIKYTQRQIRDLLTMIDNGNKVTPSRSYIKSGGLQKTASGFGLLGFVRFLEGYYMVLITKKTCAALIGGHAIYKVEDTVMIPIPHEGIRRHDPNEARYLQTFQNVDLSSSFYFSYSYDITHPLQHNMRPHSFWKECAQARSGFIPWTPCGRFFWNEYLLGRIRHTVDKDWVLVAMQGFISQANISVFGRPIYISLIARRSKEYAGCRFLKRGANDQGFVANEVETEQIVHDASHLSHNTGWFTSYLQVRGSVPLFWSQESSGMTPKPPIVMDRIDPFSSAAALHFNNVFERYGTPVYVLNLVKKRERRPRESILSDNLQPALHYLNQFIPPELHIQYIHFDMARVTRSKDSNVLDRLDRIAEKAFASTGFFHSGPELSCNQQSSHPQYSKVGGIGYRPHHPYRLQTGVVRVNCVDCLDRTNTAQFVIGKRALGFQLYALGVVDSPILELDTDCMRLFESLYEAHGDVIALQYGGSQLVHRIRTYRKLAQWTAHSRDIMQTISRYYSNAFTDFDKQCAINLFLGKFQPKPMQSPLWELPTDYYLHHLEPAGFNPTRRSYTAWLSGHLFQSLPLPYQEEVDLSAGDDAPMPSSPDMGSPPSISTPPAEFPPSALSSRTRSASMRDDVAVFGGRTGLRSGTFLKYTFLDHYQPWELSGFEDYDFCHSMLSTMQLQDKANPSPFVVRKKLKKNIVPQAGVGPRPSVAGSPGVHSSGSDTTSSDDGDSTDEEKVQDSAVNGSGDTGEQAPSSSGDHGAIELPFPNSSDFQQYMKHADQFVSSSVQKQPTDSVYPVSSSVSNAGLWYSPPSRPSSQSSFHIDTPTVSMASYDTYKAAVDVARHGPNSVSQDEYNMYLGFC